MKLVSKSQPVRAYHLMSADHGISSIALSRLKVARISDVNDIFELFAVNCINQQVRTALKAFKATQDAKLGLLCFSEQWKNPVLWSHYADSHRGICLGFDIHSSLHPTKVQYVTKKLRVDPDECGAPHGIAIPEEVQELLFVTKFTHWSYEEEVR